MPTERPSQPSSSGGIHVGDVSGNVNFSALGHIVGGNLTISTTVQISVDAVTQRPLVTTSPYRGLDRFEDRDKDLFFGRDQFVKTLLTELGNSNLLLVLGASGSGKSSVVRAGLLPALSGLFGARFRYFTMVPDANPFESLRSSLQSAGFSQSQTRALADAQPGAPSELFHALQREGEQWLLFVDQFEEIFTRSDESLRKNFIEALLVIAQDAAGSTKLVLAMRADFLDRFGPFPQFAKQIEKSIGLVADMHADEVRLAIEQPAALHGVVFERGLVEEIIKDVQGQAGSLPLLQYALDLLWEEERRSDGLADRHLNTRSYRELGGVRGALQKRADEIYAAFGDSSEPKRANAKQETARQIFLRLVDIAGVGPDDAVWRPVRRRVPMTLFNTAQEQELLQELIKQKLLVSTKEQDTEASVEVAHEALFTSWERLKKWIEGGRQIIFVRNRLADDARRWHRRQQEDMAGAEEELLSGSRLGQALEMRARGDFVTLFGGLPETETQFLDASAAVRDRRRQEEQERQQRELAQAQALATEQQKRADDQTKAATRQRRLTMATLVVSLLAAVAAVFSLAQRRAAMEAASNARVAGSNAVAASQQAITNEQRANRQLAQADWLAGQGERGSPYVAREESTIKAAHYLLRAASAATSAMDQPATINAAMAAKVAGASILRSLVHDGDVVGATNSPDGQRILTWSADGSARLWNASDGKPVGEPMKHESSIFGAVFRADGQGILTWSSDGTARFWNATDGKAVGEPMKHESSVDGAVYSADGKRILTWSWDGTARLWNASDEKAVGQPMKHEEPVNGAMYSADGQRILTWSSDGTARLWNATDGKTVGQPMKHESSIFGAIYRADGKRILTWSADGTARLWKASDGKTVGESMEHKSSVDGAVYSEDGQYILTWSMDGTARLWIAADGRAASQPMKHELRVNGAIYIADGERILTWSEDGTARLWNTRDGKAVGQPMKHESSIFGAVYSADGQRIVTWSEDGTARLWNASDGKAVGQPMRHELRVNGALYSEHGQRIVTWSEDGTARLWNASDGKAVGQPMRHESSIFGAVYCADGKRILTWSWDGTARLWNASDGKAVGQPMKHALRITGAIYGADGKRILTWSEDGTTRLWQASDGKTVGEPMKHEGPVKGALFSTDGQRILTWSHDGTARLWSAGNSQCIALFRHDKSLTSARFNRDETRVLTVSADGTARQWDIALDASIPVEERVLEFEVRSATTIGSDGQVHVLSVAEWEKRQAELLDMEIRSGKAIFQPGDARRLTPEELTTKRRQLAELRQSLGK